MWTSARNHAMQWTRGGVVSDSRARCREPLIAGVRSQRTEDSAVERRVAGQRSAGTPVALNRCGSPFGDVECRQQETANDACRIVACSTWPPEV